MPGAQAIRGAAEVSRKILDCADVGTCGMLSVIKTLEFFQHHFAKSGHGDLLMTRQLISTNNQPLLRSPHAKRPPHGRLRPNGEYRHCGLLPAPSIRCKGSRRHSCEHLFLLDRTIETEERGGGLAAQFEAAPHLGWRAGWARSSLPRHVLGGTPPCGCTD